MSDTANDTRDETGDAAPDDAQYRAWVRERIAKSTRDEPKCEHVGHMEYGTCVVCAWHLGRAEGQLDAGAYMTDEEFHAAMREMIATHPPLGRTTG